MVALVGVEDCVPSFTSRKISDLLPWRPFRVGGSDAVLVESSEVDAESDLVCSLLWDDDDWMEPVVCLRSLVNLLQDAGLHLFFDLRPQWLHVSFCNSSVGTGCCRNGIGSEFDVGWRSLDAPDVAAKDLWELLGDVLQIFGLRE